MYVLYIVINFMKVLLHIHKKKNENWHLLSYKCLDSD